MKIRRSRSEYLHLKSGGALLVPLKDGGVTLSSVEEFDQQNLFSREVPWATFIVYLHLCSQWVHMTDIMGYACFIRWPVRFSRHGSCLSCFFSCLLIEPNQALQKSAGSSDWERSQENSESKTVGNKWSPRAGAAERTDLTRQVRRKDCNEGNLITFFCLRNQSTEVKGIIQSQPFLGQRPWQQQSCGVKILPPYHHLILHRLNIQP